jgi:hypothetical protein
VTDGPMVSCSSPLAVLLLSRSVAVAPRMNGWVHVAAPASACAAPWRCCRIAAAGSPGCVVCHWEPDHLCTYGARLSRCWTSRCIQILGGHWLLIFYVH